MRTRDPKLKEAAEACRAGRAEQAAMLATGALTDARASADVLRVAFTLRHTADVHSRLGNFAQAGDEIAEAIRIYRADAREHASDGALDLANALRVAALNAERAALAAWQEAQTLYTLVDVQAGVAGAQHHLQHLPASLGRDLMTLQRGIS